MSALLAQVPPSAIPGDPCRGLQPGEYRIIVDRATHPECEPHRCYFGIVQFPCGGSAPVAGSGAAELDANAEWQLRHGCSCTRGGECDRFAEQCAPRELAVAA